MRSLVALVAVVAVVALAGCGGSDSKPLLAGGKAAAVRGGLTPDVHLFGEPVVAHVDVIVDREQVDPDAVRVKTDFTPASFSGYPHSWDMRVARAARILPTREG